MATTKVTDKGQITLPVTTREVSDTNTSDPMRVHVVGDEIVLENQRNWARETSGIFKKYAERVARLDPDAERQWFERSVAIQVVSSLEDESRG